MSTHARLLWLALFASTYSGCAFLGSLVGPGAKVAAYERELDHCIELARPTHNFAVYESCARAVDRKYGVDGGAE